MVFDMENLRYITGFVPFYVKRYMNMDESRFVQETVEDVRVVLEKFEIQYGETSVGKKSWKAACNVIVCFLMGIKARIKTTFRPQVFPIQ